MQCFPEEKGKDEETREGVRKAPGAKREEKRSAWEQASMALWPVPSMTFVTFVTFIFPKG